MDRRNNSSKVWPAPAVRQDDDDIFSEVDFDRENDFGNPDSLLGESAPLFEAGLPANDDAVFSGVEFDEAGSLLQSHQAGGRRQGTDDNREGRGRRKRGAAAVERRGRGRNARGDGDRLSDVDSDDDDDDVAFGKEDTRIVRAREEQEKKRQKQQMDRLVSQVKTLTDRMYEFREQSVKAKQELAALQEENKELKIRLEQDHSPGIIPSFLAYSSFDTSNRNLYAIMVVLTTTVQVISATVKWIREDKIRKELFIVDEEQKHVQFAKTFLVGWDNSLSNQQEVEDYRLSNGLAAANMLAEISQADASATRSLDDKIWLYGYRCFGFALYVGVQMAAWAAIIILTAESDNLATGLAQQLQSVAWISQAAAVISTSIVPATVSIINAIMPIIIKAITKLEKWDMERTVTYMLTIRMFLAKILNAFIQALSYLLLADPYLLAGEQYMKVINRGRVEQTFEPTGFDCRLDQAGAGLFQLVVTEFVFSKIINYATLRVSQVKAKYTKKQFKKPEFEVAKRMVGLLYFQALILAAYPFFPMGTVFVAPFLILSFKFEKKLLTTFQSKPKGRLKAHDGYSFFIKFYLATLVLLGVMATLFLIGGTTFAKDCNFQDQGVGLCGAELDTNFACTLSTDNTFYDYFSEKCKAPLDEYPACVCKDKLACGPFVEVTSAYNSLNTQVRSISIVGYIYGFLVDNSIVLWGTCIVLWLAILFQRNSSQTHADAAADREREWLNEAQTTQARLKKQAKLIEKMQLQAGALLFDET
eukprot:g11048.t1